MMVNMKDGGGTKFTLRKGVELFNPTLSLCAFVLCATRPGPYTVLYIQGGPSGQGKSFVDIETRVGVYN